MSLFRKLFGKKKDPSEETIPNEERGKYMPEIKLPADERFTINFKANGGKFLYCENMDEIKDSFNSILIENNWHNKKAFIIDERLEELFKGFDLKKSNKISETSYFLSTCEYLISDDGSLLISSNQIAETDEPNHGRLWRGKHGRIQTVPWQNARRNRIPAVRQTGSTIRNQHGNVRMR